MNCPICGHRDVRDHAVVRGHHVFICRKCGAVLEKIERLVKLTDSATLRALV